MTVNHRNFYEALEYLINEVSNIKAIMGIAQTETGKKEEDLIDMEEVCRLTGRAKPTIYRMTSRGEIPCYKNGNKLYFFRSEIMTWIRGGKKGFVDDIIAEGEAYSLSKFVRRG